MKSKLIVAAVVVCFEVMPHAQAQTGLVAWTSLASLCKITGGTGLASSTIFGGVTFSGSNSGTISLTCAVSTFMRVDPTAVNAFGLTFYNKNGFAGGVNQCTITAGAGAYPYSGAFRTGIGSFSTAGQTYSGRQTVTVPLQATLNVDTNFYAINIALTRQAGATCNPKVVLAFMEDVIQ